MPEKFATLRICVRIVLIIACALSIAVIFTAVAYVFIKYQIDPLYARFIIFAAAAGSVMLVLSSLAIVYLVRLFVDVEAEMDTMVKLGGQLRGHLQGIYNSLKKIESAGVGKRKVVDTKELLALAEESVRPYELSEAQAARKSVLLDLKNAISDKRWQQALDSACLFVGRYPETEEAQGLLSLISKLKLKLGRCPQCDTVVAETQIRCPNCGYEFEEAKEPI